ncbi:MAG: rhodanese-like domain-containing protein [Flavobacteriales bacterium]|jgi:phage shock protein E
MDLEKLITDANATLIDVRTPAEYAGGHVNGSINIPLQEVPYRVEEIKALSRPLIMCCASGNRSGQAEYFLRNQGLESVYNGGSWLDVNYFANKQNA